MVGLPEYGARMPAQLSGGQQQRVALARVLATDPRVLLFDEPLSALDRNLRDTLKYAILELQRRTGKTAIYVTHDQSEAFAISDRIVVMNAGRVEQIGTQMDIYLEPRTPFVAEFIGANNVLPGVVERVGAADEGGEAGSGGGCGRDLVDLTMQARDDLILTGRGRGDLAVGDRVVAYLRPEDITVLDDGAPPTRPNVVEADVERVIFEGPTVQLRVRVGDRPLRVDVGGGRRLTLAEQGPDGPPRVRRPDRHPRGGGGRGRRRRSESEEADFVTDRPDRSRRAASRSVFGHQLVGELPAFVHRPYLVVTMADLWPRFEDQLAGPHLAGVHLVETLELDDLVALEQTLPRANAIIGLGGGQAIDVAKFFAWTRRLPLFQVPTATTVNAPFGHRSGVRDHGRVRYLGWAIPEAVYIDFDVIASAPPNLNRSGIGDVLCYHTARFDWQLADRLGRTEAALAVRPAPRGRRGHRHGIGRRRARRDPRGHRGGIRALVLANRWGGTTFHDSGWNPRHIEGVDHFVFYNLERITGRHFIHGQPVGLGIVAGSVLQDNEPEAMAAAIARAGVDIRPEAMGVTWDDVAEALRTLGRYVREVGSVVLGGRHRDRRRAGDRPGPRDRRWHVRCLA